MKIKKSELLALIKEEIMDEMRGLTVMDDPYDDDAVPAGMEPGGTMDVVSDMMEHAIMTSMDDLISMISNHLVTTSGNRDARELMAEGMRMLHDAGFRKPDADALERMIADEDDDDDMGMMMENITDPAVQQVLIDVAAKLAPLVSFVSVPVLIKALVDQIRKEGSGKKRGEM